VVTFSSLIFTAIYFHTKIIVSIYAANPHIQIGNQHFEKDTGFLIFFLLIRRKKWTERIKIATTTVVLQICTHFSFRFTARNLVPKY